MRIFEFGDEIAILGSVCPTAIAIDTIDQSLVLGLGTVAESVGCSDCFGGLEPVPDVKCDRNTVRPAQSSGSSELNSDATARDDRSDRD